MGLGFVCMGLEGNASSRQPLSAVLLGADVEGAQYGLVRKFFSFRLCLSKLRKMGIYATEPTAGCSEMVPSLGNWEAPHVLLGLLLLCG